MAELADVDAVPVPSVPEKTTYDPGDVPGTGGLCMLQFLALPLAFPNPPLAGAPSYKKASFRVQGGNFYSPRSRPGGHTVLHQAIDLVADRGTPIVSPAQLKVIAVGWNELGGWYVTGRAKLASSGRLARVYMAHLMQPSHLAPGAVIQAGDLVGYVGNTKGPNKGDRLAGPFHLHLQLSEEMHPGRGDYAYKDPYFQIRALSVPLDQKGVARGPLPTTFATLPLLMSQIAAHPPRE